MLRQKIYLQPGASINNIVGLSVSKNYPHKQKLDAINYVREWVNESVWTPFWTQLHGWKDPHFAKKKLHKIYYKQHKKFFELL